MTEKEFNKKWSKKFGKLESFIAKQVNEHHKQELCLMAGIRPTVALKKKDIARLFCNDIAMYLEANYDNN